jgi:hypothetical protein
MRDRGSKLARGNFVFPVGSRGVNCALGGVNCALGCAAVRGAHDATSRPKVSASSTPMARASSAS